MSDNKIEKKVSDLEQILTELGEQNSTLLIHAGNIMDSANKFKNCEIPSNKEDAVQKEPAGIIELLQQEIRKMKYSNEKLRIARVGFESIVG